MCGKTIILSLTALGLMFGQKFEAISIKPNRSATERSSLRIETDRFSASNVPVASLIEAAYDVKTYQVFGAPDWISTERFDIEAKSDRPVTRDEINEMLRSLLTDRLMLAAHRETRDIPVFSLTLAKGGSKLTEAAPDDHPQVLLSMNGPKMRLTGSKASIGLLMPWLNSILASTSRPVLDDTGLTARYDFKMEWLPDDAPPGSATDGPSIYTAIQEQLGLRLDAKKAPFDLLAIDHIERPSAN